MWKLIITKLFCHHKWLTHNTKQNYRSDETTEVLICQECGKIKILRY